MLGTAARIGGTNYLTQLSGVHCRSPGAFRLFYRSRWTVEGAVCKAQNDHTVAPLDSVPYFLVSLRNQYRPVAEVNLTGSPSALPLGSDLIARTRGRILQQGFVESGLVRYQCPPSTSSRIG